jgi:hypothetical protein
MSESARVTSIDAIKDFQEGLSSFCEEAKQALLAIDMEAQRVLQWLQHDQHSFWRMTVRNRQEDVTEAKGALFRKKIAKISGERPDYLEEQEAVWMAQKRLEEAEEKLERCRHWARVVQKAMEEYQAPAQQLATMVEGQPPRSVVALNQIIDALESYVALSPSLEPPPVTSAEPAKSVDGNR